MIHGVALTRLLQNCESLAARFLTQLLCDVFDEGNASEFCGKFFRRALNLGACVAEL